MSHNQDIRELDIRQLLDGTDNYMIPIYQRNYAWEEKEIEQLLQDILDYIPKVYDKKINYFIGTLIINKNIQNNAIFYETIDGQQRLTTLSILACVLKHKMGVDWYNTINLSFQSRSSSTETLEAIFQENIQNNKIYNDNIINGYSLIIKHLDKKLAEADVSLTTFSDFLFNQVKIVRVQVPDDTDLNHYFEIMNTRGEQLEKHEVLKANLLNVYNELTDDVEREKKFNVFNQIWEAASDLNYYMQYSYTNTNLREKLFGKEWNTLMVSEYEDLYNLLMDDNVSEQEDFLSVNDILEEHKSFENKTTTSEESERFSSIINFQNFLLHILRIQEKNKDVVLDDKKLIVIFNSVLKLQQDKIKFVDRFIFNLFKMRFLFDKYIIKREDVSGKESWSLKTLKRYEKSQTSYVNTFGVDTDYENDTVVMLQSMFHVSTPTMIYKHWLNAVLSYLHQNSSIAIDIDGFVSNMEQFAKSLLLHRFLVNSPKDYFDLIYNNEDLNLNDYKIHYDNPKLNYGKIENNLIFNFLDYILWKNKDSAVPDNFEFTFRSSVEHFYPQNPIGGDPLPDKDALHSFGNLCLISHSKNSKLNNHLPSAKKDYFQKSEGKLEIDSLKLNIMLNNYENDWNVTSIKDHHQKMIDVFNNFITNLK